MYGGEANVAGLQTATTSAIHSSAENTPADHFDSRLGRLERVGIAVPARLSAARARLQTS
jgi:hypothetical protein